MQCTTEGGDPNDDDWRMETRIFPEMLRYRPLFAEQLEGAQAARFGMALDRTVVQSRDHIRTLDE